MNMKTMISKMTNYLVSHKEGTEGQSNEDSVNPEEFWPILFDVINNHLHLFGHIFTIVSQYLKNEPTHRTKKVEFLERQISEFLAPGPISDKIQRSKAIVRLLPFLPRQHIIPILEECIRYTGELMQGFPSESNPSFPEDALSPFEDCISSFIDDEALDEVVDLFHSNIENPTKFIPTLAVYANLLPDIIDVRPEESAPINELISKCLTSSDISKQVTACFSLQFLCQNSNNGINDDPEEEDSNDSILKGIQLYHLLRPLMLSDNNLLRKYSSHAAADAVNSKLMSDSTIIKEFISDFQSFSKSPVHMRTFFKLLDVFVEPDADFDDLDSGPDLDLLEVVLKFITDTLFHTTNTLACAFCMDALTNLVSAQDNDATFLEDLIDQILTKATSFVQSNDFPTFTVFSSVLVVLSRAFSQQSSAQLNALVLPLSAHLSDDRLGKLPRRIDLACDLAQLIKRGFGTPTELTTVYDFAMNTMHSELKSAVHACAIFIGLRTKLSTEQAISAFDIVASRLNDCNNDPELALPLLQTLAKLLAKHSIPSAEPVVVKLLNAPSYSFLGGKTLTTVEEPLEPASTLISQFARKFPAKVRSIIEPLVAYVVASGQQLSSPDNVAFEESTASLPGILGSLATAIEVGALDLETTRRVASGVLEVLENVSMDNVDLISACIGIVRPIWDSFREVLSPPQRLLNALARFVNEASTEEEDKFDDVAELIEKTIPDITVFILGVFVDDEEVELNVGLIMNLLGLLPFPPMVQQMADIMDLVSQMAENKERFEEVLLPTCHVLTDLLMMKQGELAEYEFPTELTKQMKAALKSAVKGNKTLEKQITKEFAGKRALLNRFNSLIR